MPFRGAAKRGLITSVTSRVPSGRTTASTSKLSMTVCDAAGTGAATRTASRGANPSTLRRARRSRIPGLIGLASPALLSGGAEADLGHFTLGGRRPLKKNPPPPGDAAPPPGKAQGRLRRPPPEARRRDATTHPLSHTPPVSPINPTPPPAAPPPPPPRPRGGPPPPPSGAAAQTHPGPFPRRGRPPLKKTPPL